MLKYMYSKTRGGTPSRYRLNEEDFIDLNFPIVDDNERKAKANAFEESLVEYHKTIHNAEVELMKSHTKIENDL